MDPWYHHVNTIPRVLISKGYMDDNATGGLGLSWLLPTQILIQKFSDAGFQVLSHSWYLIKPLPSVTSTLPLIESCPPVIAGFSSLFAAYQGIPPPPFVQLQSGTCAITIPSSWISSSTVFAIPSHPNLLPLLHSSPCVCKCKTYLIPNFKLTAQDLLYLDSTPLGAKIVSPAATMLGLYLHSPFSTLLPSSSDSSVPVNSPLLPLAQIEAHQSHKAFLAMERRASSFFS